MEDAITTGDYLQGFYLGTRDALYEKGRQSITLTLNEVNPESVGQLIALFERAVGFYASLVNINAYHQPGVEAGKKAAAAVLELESAALEFLRAQPGKSFSAPQLAEALGRPADAESLYKILNRLAANDRGIGTEPGSDLDATTFHAA